MRRAFIIPAACLALAACADGVVLRTVDNGRHWELLRRSPGQTLKALASLPGSGVVLALADRTVLRGDLATNTWQEPAWRKAPAPWRCGTAPRGTRAPCRSRKWWPGCARKSRSAASTGDAAPFAACGAGADAAGRASGGFGGVNTFGPL